MLCPNYYDNQNELCISCEYSDECKEDCEAYELKNKE